MCTEVDGAVIKVSVNNDKGRYSQEMLILSKYILTQERGERKLNKVATKDVAGTTKKRLFRERNISRSLVRRYLMVFIIFLRITEKCIRKVVSIF